MPGPSFILIDFENVQPKELASLHGHPFKTKVFCGAAQNRIPIDIAAQLQPLGPDMEYIRIQGTGPNALDFHIAYYIGRLSAQFPGATFHIVSKDTGFDPLIKHLKAQDTTCHRLPSLTDLLRLASSPSPHASDRIQKAAHSLLHRKSGKPGKLGTLTTSIQSLLNEQASEAAVGAVIELLKQAGMSTQPDGKVIWPST